MRAPTGGGRLEWVDATRGVAILLLVFFHSTVEPLFPWGISAPSFLDPINTFLAALRMQTLMFISGIVLSRSLTRPWPQYYAGKLRRLAWPCLVWTAILLNTAGFGYFFDHYLGDISAWLGPGYLWFIFDLLVFYLIAPLLLRVLPAWSIPVALGVAAIALDGSGLPFESVPYYAAFFFAGHALKEWITRPRVFPESISRWRAAALIIALSACGVTAGIASVLTNWKLATSPWMLPFGLGGVLAFCFLMRWAGATGPTRVVRWIGRNSIVFYLSHWPVMIGTTHLIVATTIDHRWYFVILFAVALAAGAVLTFLKRWAPVRWLFEAPRPWAALRRWREQAPPRGVVVDARPQ